jgi:hypothetical protein
MVTCDGMQCIVIEARCTASFSSKPRRAVAQQQFVAELNPQLAIGEMRKPVTEGGRGKSPTSRLPISQNFPNIRSQFVRRTHHVAIAADMFQHSERSRTEGMETTVGNVAVMSNSEPFTGVNKSRIFGKPALRRFRTSSSRTQLTQCHSCRLPVNLSASVLNLTSTFNTSA